MLMLLRKCFNRTIGWSVGVAGEGSADKFCSFAELNSNGDGEDHVLHS